VQAAGAYPTDRKGPLRDWTHCVIWYKYLNQFKKISGGGTGFESRPLRQFSVSCVCMWQMPALLKWTKRRFCVTDAQSTVPS